VHKKAMILGRNSSAMKNFLSIKMESSKCKIQAGSYLLFLSFQFAIYNLHFAMITY